MRLQITFATLLKEIIAGSVPGVTFEQMKLQIKLGVPHSLQQSLDIDRIKGVFP